MTGDLYGAEFCYRTIPEELDIFDHQTFEENPMEFYVVCTDVFTGEPVYRRVDRADENGYLWMRASASMPFSMNTSITPAVNIPRIAPPSKTRPVPMLIPSYASRRIIRR